MFRPPINGGTYQLGEIIYVLTATTSVIQPLPVQPSADLGNYMHINPSLGFTPGTRLTIGTVWGRIHESAKLDRIHFPGAEQLVGAKQHHRQLPFENTLFTGFSPPRRSLRYRTTRP